MVALFGAVPKDGCSLNRLRFRAVGSSPPAQLFCERASARSLGHRLCLGGWVGRGGFWQRGGFWMLLVTSQGWGHGH